MSRDRRGSSSGVSDGKSPTLREGSGQLRQRFVPFTRIGSI